MGLLLERLPAFSRFSINNTQMRKLSTLPFLPLFLLIAGALPAQETAFERQCGTLFEENPWLVYFQSNQAAFPRSPETLYVPLAVHVVGDKAGNGYFSMEQVLAALCALNEDFEQSDIQFYLGGPLRYISSDNYFNHDYGGGIEMMTAYNQANTVNCYVVNNAAGYCGYAFYTLGIVLNKSCLEPGSHTWAHEMGHYLSLPHTFQGWEGVSQNYSQNAPATINGRAVELADGSNCQQAGDGFCDTPADYLNDRWACLSNGKSAQLQRDPAGHAFRSEGSLLMSYAEDACANRFSQGQIDAMRANLKSQRPNLLAEAPLPQLLAGTVSGPVIPAQDELITNVSRMNMQWPAVPGAEGYVVFLSLLAPGGESEIPYMVYYTLGNSLDIDGLLSERSWRWRVKPYNRFDACAPLSEAFAFDTGYFISNTKEQATFSDFKLHPNPQYAGGPVFVEFELPAAFNLHIFLYASTGQPLRYLPLYGHYGYNETAFPTQGLPPGLYWLGIEHAGGRKYQKLVLQ